jgi:hypothetical protein
MTRYVVINTTGFLYLLNCTNNTAARGIKMLKLVSTYSNFTEGAATCSSAQSAAKQDRKSRSDYSTAASLKLHVCLYEHVHFHFAHIKRLDTEIYAIGSKFKVGI